MINKLMLKNQQLCWKFPKKELKLVKPGIIVSKRNNKKAVENKFNPELLKEKRCISNKYI